MHQAKQILREIKKKAEIETFNDSNTESVVDDNKEYQSAHGNSDLNNNDNCNNNNDDTSGGDLEEPTALPLRIPIPSAITTTELASIGLVIAVLVTTPLASVNVSASSMKARSLQLLPSLIHVSTLRRGKKISNEDDMSVSEFFKYSMMLREQNRKEREEKDQRRIAELREERL